MPFDWTEEREATVTKMWEDGHSAQQIADRLGGVTRNAVIGKVRRLKLPFRAGHGRFALHGRKKSGERRVLGIVSKGQGYRFMPPEFSGSITHELAAAQIEHGPDLVIPPAERRGLDALEPGDCRWPFGDPRTADYHYCNRMAVGAPDRLHRGALPYCEFHAKRAYRPVTPARTAAEVGNPMLFHHKGSTGVSTKELAEFDELKR